MGLHNDSENQVLRMQSGRLLPSTGIDPRFVSCCVCFPSDMHSSNTHTLITSLDEIATNYLTEI
jgi:hypothetical protein